MARKKTPDPTPENDGPAPSLPAKLECVECGAWENADPRPDKCGKCGGDRLVDPTIPGGFVADALARVKCSACGHTQLGGTACGACETAGTLEPFVKAPEDAAARVALADHPFTVGTITDVADPDFPCTVCGWKLAEHGEVRLESTAEVAGAAVTVTDYAVGPDGEPVAVDVPVNVAPSGQTTLPGVDMAALRVGVWEPVDDYVPTSVELGFGGRVELSFNAHDRALAERLRLNKQLRLTTFVRVDGRFAKVLRKKGSFDGVTVKVPLHVIGIGLDEPEDYDSGDLLLLNQIESLTGKLESLGAAAADLVANKPTLAQLRAFVRNVAELADSSPPEDDIDDPLEEALAEAMAEDDVDPD